MTSTNIEGISPAHSHVFLGTGHEKNERRTWIVIALCSAMMVAEIAGGALFGSLALIADGLHMSTHAGALMLAAVAYTYARTHATDPKFAFGTGKVGDLAGYTSAIILAMIALLIAYEAVVRMLHPVAIDFNEAIPIAVVGLLVNLASAWLLSGSDRGHSHGHYHTEGNGAHDDPKRVDTDAGPIVLEIFEDGVPPRFRIRAEAGTLKDLEKAIVEIRRPGGERQSFDLVDRGLFRESLDEIPEPHAFFATLKIVRGGRTDEYPVTFEEHGHGAAVDAHGMHHRDNNMRAALVHVVADAAVSVLVIAGLLLARSFGWLWMDPLAGLIGAAVIANWAWGLVGDTGAILLDRSADSGIERRIRAAVADKGDTVGDLHLWRLGPGHLGLILSVVTDRTCATDYYRSLLGRFPSISHVTVEVQQPHT
jgi:cation diffusion facilitator family transporter